MFNLEVEDYLFEGKLYKNLNTSSHKTIMSYLESYPYSIWEFTFCGMINDLEFGDIFYKETDNSLVIYFKAHSTGLIQLYAPVFCDKNILNQYMFDEFTFLKKSSNIPRLMRISPDEKPLIDLEKFNIIDKNIPLFTIHTDNIKDLQKPNFRRLRRSVNACKKNFENCEIKDYNNSNEDIIRELRRKWHNDAIDRGLTPDNADAFNYLLTKQKEFDITSYEIYINNELAGFISFCPHHGETGINIYRIADNNLKGVSSFGYYEALLKINSKFKTILDGSGSRKSLYEFKQQFTDIVYNEYAVELKT